MKNMNNEAYRPRLQFPYEIWVTCYPVGLGSRERPTGEMCCSYNWGTSCYFPFRAKWIPLYVVQYYSVVYRSLPCLNYASHFTQHFVGDADCPTFHSTDCTCTCMWNLDNRELRYNCTVVTRTLAKTSHHSYTDHFFICASTTTSSTVDMLVMGALARSAEFQSPSNRLCSIQCSPNT